MLYPNFQDLVAFKNKKLKLVPFSRRLVKSTTSGGYHSPFRGRGLEFDAVREYVPGDDIRCIDWRVTARTGRPHLKVFKEDRERQVMICVDMNSYMRFGTRNTFKSIQAARVAAFLGWQGMASQDRVSGYLFGDIAERIQFFPPKRTHNSFVSMLKCLAVPHIEQPIVSLKEVLLNVARVAHSGSFVYLISDFMNLNQNLPDDSEINRLSSRLNLIFIAINDFADRVMFPIGSIKFSSNDKNSLSVNTESITGREKYAAQWEENRQQLYEISRKFKIPIIELTTESNLPQDLISGLKGIKRC